MPTLIESPADWRPAAITARGDWIHHFSDAEVAEIDRLWPAERHRAGLIEQHTVGLCQPFERAAVFHEYTCPHQRTRGDNLCHRYSKP